MSNLKEKNVEKKMGHFGFSVWGEEFPKTGVPNPGGRWQKMGHVPFFTYSFPHTLQDSHGFSCYEHINNFEH